jgi:hypothetical protein
MVTEASLSGKAAEEAPMNPFTSRHTMDQRKNNTHKRTHVAAEARKSRGSGKAVIEGRTMLD